MTSPLEVHLSVTPRHLPEPAPERPTGALVIDVLRATTTLAYAFRAGAREARFYRTPDAARRAAQRAPHAALLCGERLGYRLPDFDLGNSPAEYTADRVLGCSLLFASTNGSPAFLDSGFAATQWSVGFVNAQAAVGVVAEWVEARLRTPGGDGAPRLLFVCAGKEGEPAIEDSLCAALLLSRLEARLGGSGVRLAPSGDRLPPPPAGPEEAARAVRESPHGRYLRSLGAQFVTDVERCAEWDVLSTVPTGGRGRLSRTGSPAP